MKMTDDEKYMHLAILEAKKAREMDEVPIGAIIVHQDELIAAGYNIRETTQSALCHAELIAIKEANEKLGSWRLDRKSTRLNSSHVSISYAVFCLKKKR